MSSSALKRRDIGLAGAIITLAQVLASLHSERNLSKELDEIKFEFRVSKSETEKYFVKKEELKKVSSKLERIDEKLAKISQQVRSITTVGYEYESDDEVNTIGCIYKKKISDQDFKGDI